MAVTDSTGSAGTADAGIPSQGTLEVSIFRSPRVANMYLYVPCGDCSTTAEEQQQALQELLPAELLKRFGEPVFSFNLTLWPDRPLAQADALVVLAAIGKQGFYLQMPPQET